MASMQELEISIAPDGTVSFQIKGVKGPKCLDETKFLEEALGGEVLSREKTSDFYQEDQAGASQWVGGEEDDD